MEYIKVYTVCLLIIHSSLFGANVGLEELLMYATKNSVSLKIKETDISIEAKKVESIKSGYYPVISMIYSTEYTKSLDGTPLGTETVGGITISNGTRYQSSLALQLNYDVYDFGAMDKSIKIAYNNIDIKRFEWCTLENDIHRQILEHYANARRAFIQRKYKKDMLRMRKKLYLIKERLYKAGKISKIELGEEAMRILSLQSEIEKISINYRTEIDKLSQLSRKDLAENVILLPIERSYKIFLNDKPDFEKTNEAFMLKRKIEQKREEISLLGSKQLPNISFYSNYYFYKSDPQKYYRAVSGIRKRSWNIGFALRYNIFNGFKDSSEKSRLQLELHRLEQEFYEAKFKYDHEIKNKQKKIKDYDLVLREFELLLEKSKAKQNMVARLFETKRIDKVRKIESEYELLEKKLGIELEKIEYALEKASLSILNKGVRQCSLR